MRYNKFNTIYSNARQYVLSREAGPRLVDQLTFDRRSVSYQRYVYLSFRQTVQAMFNIDIDSNGWVFDQNQLKTIHNGRESLKELCLSFYSNNEALFIANTI